MTRRELFLAAGAAFVGGIGAAIVKPCPHFPAEIVGLNTPLPPGYYVLKWERVGKHMIAYLEGEDGRYYAPTRDLLRGFFGNDVEIGYPQLAVTPQGNVVTRTNGFWTSVRMDRLSRGSGQITTRLGAL